MTTRFVFKISDTCSEWVKAFDDDRTNQEVSRIKAIFRGVSETDSSTVIAKIETEPGFLGKYMEGNKAVAASGRFFGSEGFSN